MATAAAPDPSLQDQQPQAKRRHPWHWIVPCVLLLLVAAGLAIWALSLQSDLDDERAHSAQVEQQAQSAITDVEDSVKGLGDRAATAKDKLGKAIEDAKSDAE